MPAAWHIIIISGWAYLETGPDLLCELLQAGRAEPGLEEVTGWCAALVARGGGGMLAPKGLHQAVLLALVEEPLWVGG